MPVTFTLLNLYLGLNTYQISLKGSHYKGLLNLHNRYCTLDQR
jgi:hypothetical protein